MLIQININVLATGQDLILVQNFHLQMESLEKKVIIFEAEMNSSAHIDNKNNNILISVQGPMQELGDTTLTSEEKFSINFT